MDYIASFFKFLAGIAIVSLAFLYLTRPETQITEKAFISAAKDSGYNVFRTKTRGALNSYVAKNTNNGTEIYYANFKTKEEAHDFYTKTMDVTKEKYSYRTTRDIRLGKASAEKQSYMDYDTFHIGIYAKDTVAYCSAHEQYRKEINAIFDKLYQPVTLDLMKIQSDISEAFLKLKSAK